MPYTYIYVRVYKQRFAIEVESLGRTNVKEIRDLYKPFAPVFIPTVRRRRRRWTGNVSTPTTTVDRHCSNIIATYWKEKKKKKEKTAKRRKTVIEWSRRNRNKQGDTWTWITNLKTHTHLSQYYYIKLLNFGLLESRSEIYQTRYRITRDENWLLTIDCKVWIILKVIIIVRWSYFHHRKISVFSVLLFSHWSIEITLDFWQFNQNKNLDTNQFLKMLKDNYRVMFFLPNKNC